MSGRDERAEGDAVVRGGGPQAARADGTAGAAAGAGARPGEGTREEPPGPKLRAVSMVFNVPLLRRNNN